MATGKILLAEILEREEVPLVVLYDTSQDDDININAACMKALQDRSLESPLKVTKNRSVWYYNETLITKKKKKLCWYHGTDAKVPQEYHVSAKVLYYYSI